MLKATWQEVLKSWKNAGEIIDILIQVDADELAMDIPYDDNLTVLDVRNENEFAEGHVKDAMNLPLSNMTDPAQIALLEENQNIYVHCGGGYRSVIALSLLKRQGYHNLRNVSGRLDENKRAKKYQNRKRSQCAELMNFLITCPVLMILL